MTGNPFSCARPCSLPFTRSQFLLVCISEEVANLPEMPLGEATIINNDLQGAPDNIRRLHRADGSVAYSVALGSKRSLPFSLPQIVAPYPIIRQALALLDIETTAAIIPQ